MSKELAEWRYRIAQSEKHNTHLQTERDKIYREVQDFTVSANKTDAAVEKMKNIDKLIKSNNKSITDLKQKIHDHEQRNNNLFTSRVQAARLQGNDFSGTSD